MAVKIPSGAQLLFYPMKECTISAGFKDPKYPTDKNHRFTHYGTDFDSKNQSDFHVLASGNGTVLGSEFNSKNSLGGILVIQYKNVYIPSTKMVKNLVVRYIHLEKLNVKKGDAVSPYQILGQASGTHISWNHIHIEVDLDTVHPFHTPQVAENSSALLIRASANDSTMIDPISVFVVGNNQTAMVHPKAVYVGAKDKPKYMEKDFIMTTTNAGSSPSDRGQTLILPVNTMKVTCGYMNPKYPVTKFSGRYLGDHYGMDFSGSTTMYASGKGEVLLSGWDACFGNVVVVLYKNIYNHVLNKTVDCVFRYYHMSNRQVSRGQSVNKDTILGVMGSTGSYSTGVHCHLEADTDTKNYQYTPTLTGITTLFRPGLRGTKDTTFNPRDVLHIKISAPDKQVVTRTSDGFTVSTDIDMPKID